MNKRRKWQRWAESEKRAILAAYDSAPKGKKAAVLKKYKVSHIVVRYWRGQRRTQRAQRIAALAPMMKRKGRPFESLGHRGSVHELTQELLRQIEAYVQGRMRAVAARIVHGMGGGR